jgi:hypothetical protein
METNSLFLVPVIFTQENTLGMGEPTFFFLVGRSFRRLWGYIYFMFDFEKYIMIIASNLRADS